MKTFPFFDWDTSPVKQWLRYGNNFVYIVDRWKNNPWQSYYHYDYLMVFLRGDETGWVAQRDQDNQHGHVGDGIETLFDCAEDACNAALGLLNQ